MPKTLGLVADPVVVAETVERTGPDAVRAELAESGVDGDIAVQDGAVTVRDRDSLAQERIPIGGARQKVAELLAADWRSPKLS